MPYSSIELNHIVLLPVVIAEWASLESERSQVAMPCVQLEAVDKFSLLKIEKGQTIAGPSANQQVPDRNLEQLLAQCTSQSFLTPASLIEFKLLRRIYFRCTRKTVLYVERVEVLRPET